MTWELKLSHDLVHLTFELLNIYKYHPNASATVSIPGALWHGELKLSRDLVHLTFELLNI